MHDKCSLIITIKWRSIYVIVEYFEQQVPLNNVTACESLTLIKREASGISPNTHSLI